MKIYLDDDCDSDKLIIVLRASGFEVISPRDVNARGKRDIEHLEIATKFGATILTFNHDYEIPHQDFLNKNKNHCGILLVYKYNNPKKEMKFFEIAKAIKNVLNLNLPLQNNLHRLNQFKY